MTPKIVLTTTVIIMLLHGLIFFFGAEDMARTGVPDISEKALRVGIGLAEIVAIVSVFLGIVLIFSRDIEISSAKKTLIGTGTGYHFLIERTMSKCLLRNNYSNVILYKKEPKLSLAHGMLHKQVTE